MADYSPPYTDEDAKRDRRIERARTAVKKMPVKNLTVAELLTIVNVFQRSPWDVESLENILAKRGKHGRKTRTPQS